MNFPDPPATTPSMEGPLMASDLSFWAAHGVMMLPPGTAAQVFDLLARGVEKLPAPTVGPIVASGFLPMFAKCILTILEPSALAKEPSP